MKSTDTAGQNTFIVLDHAETKPQNRSKMPLIKANSFVGITSRSKFGCISCKKKKKKCDEVYPRCGTCSKRGLDCQWKNIPINDNNDKFSISFLHLEQNHRNNEANSANAFSNRTTTTNGNSSTDKHTDINSDSGSSLNTSAMPPPKGRVVPDLIINADSSKVVKKTTRKSKANSKFNNANGGGLTIIRSSLEKNIQQNTRAVKEPVHKGKESLTQELDQRGSEDPTTKPELSDQNIPSAEFMNSYPQNTVSTQSELAQFQQIQELLKSPQFALSPLFGRTGLTPELLAANEENLDNSVENIAYGLVNYLKSPNYGPFKKESDFLINKGINHEVRLSDLDSVTHMRLDELGSPYNVTNIGNLNHSFDGHNSSHLNNNIHQQLQLQPPQQHFQQHSQQEQRHYTQQQFGLHDYQNEQQRSVQQQQNTYTQDESHNLEPYVSPMDSRRFSTQSVTGLYPKATPINADDGEGENEEEEGLHGMDESQMVENNYFTEEELLKLSLNALKSKNGLKYFKPAFQLLFKPNSYNIDHLYKFKLDDTSKLFFDYYVNHVSKSISCSSTNDKFNFFSQYLIQMALNDDSQVILNGLIAWGGMFLIGKDNIFSKKLVISSLHHIKNHFFFNQHTLENKDYLVVLSFYIILICSEVSTGDTVNWYKIFVEFKSLMDKYGGMKKFLSNNTEVDGAKWMISFFFSHDILNSKSLTNGTLIKWHEYEEVLTEDSAYDDLMNGRIDPLIGCSQNLYLIFGEIVNKGSELKKIRFSDNLTMTPVELDRHTSDVFYKLQDKIIKCKPNMEMMKELQDQKLIEVHLVLFELIQLQLLIFIRLHVKETSFDDLQLQNLCNDMNKRFDYLIGSQVQSALSLSMLLSGILSIDKESREKMTKRYELLKNSYPVTNIVRAWDIILEVWRRIDNIIDSPSTLPLSLPLTPSGGSENNAFKDISFLVDEYERKSTETGSTTESENGSSNAGEDRDKDSKDKKEDNDYGKDKDSKGKVKSKRKSKKKIYVNWVDVANDFGWQICLI